MTSRLDRQRANRRHSTGDRVTAALPKPDGVELVFLTGRTGRRTTC